MPRARDTARVLFSSSYRLYHVHTSSYPALRYLKRSAGEGERRGEARRSWCTILHGGEGEGDGGGDGGFPAVRMDSY